MTAAAALVVTRPQPQADEFVAALGRCVPRPVPATSFPLLRIEPLADTSAVAAAWRALPGTRLAMFVSANAAAAWFAAAPAGARWPAGCAAGSTGPGTSAALRAVGAAQGLAAAQIVEPDAAAGRFDSEALWQQVEGWEWRGERALIVRGEAGRDWLAERLRARGAEVELLAAYRRLPPPEDAVTLQALCRLHAAGHAWHFSSSEAIQHLGALAAAAELGAAPWHGHVAWATHPRIVQAARAAGFGRVVEVGPTPASLAGAWWRRHDAQASGAAGADT
jgi:uroporphyrinogen-III synthase